MRIRRGLDLPIDGAPAAVVDEAPPAQAVALLPSDHPGLAVRLCVAEGERVARGQPLFVDRRDDAIRFVTPQAGTVARIHRDERRRVRSVVVEVEPGDDAHGAPTPVPRWDDAGTVRAHLLEAGLWPALRSRPFGRIPRPDERPAAIFVTAMDTNPLAGPLAAVMPPLLDDLARGVDGLRTLTAGTVHVCAAPDTALPDFTSDRVRVSRFSGPHPAGLVGTHMQRLGPPALARPAWYVGWQDVAAMGRLAATGAAWTERCVALGGPSVRQPRWLRTTLGASLAPLVEGELEPGPCRIVSGSVLGGRQASGWGAYLGRYHTQVSVLPEPGRRTPAAFSFHRLIGRRRARTPWTTALGGTPAPVIPLDTFERVVPLDILPTVLLRALLVGDLDAAERLGCLELEEEDLALCSFLCPSKNDYGPLLRRALDQLAAELPEATS